MSLTLSEYLDIIGDEAAAKLFGVKVRTAQSWRLCERYPRPEQATRIVKLSRGKVDFAGIFDTTNRKAA